jgi:hypothetical protein
LWAVDEIDSAWHEFTHHIGIKCPFDFDLNPLHDFNPDFFCITGVFSDGVNPITDPRVAPTVNAGDTLLVRLLNAGYTIHEYTFEGIDAEVIDVDGRTLGRAPRDQYSAPFVIPAGTPFRLTTARRFTMLLRPTTPGAFNVEIKFIDWVTGELHHVARTVINVQ